MQENVLGERITGRHIWEGVCLLWVNSDKMVTPWSGQGPGQKVVRREG